MPNNSRIISKNFSDNFFVFRRKIDPNFRVFGYNFKLRYGKVYYRVAFKIGLKTKVGNFPLFYRVDVFPCAKAFFASTNDRLESIIAFGSFISNLLQGVLLLLASRIIHCIIQGVSRLDFWQKQSTRNYFQAKLGLCLGFQCVFLTGDGFTPTCSFPT